MAKTKISTIAKTLNVGLPTVFEFLSKKGITIDETPNTRVEQDVVDILVKEFDKDGKYAASAAAPAAPAFGAAPAAPAGGTAFPPVAEPTAPGDDLPF